MSETTTQEPSEGPVMTFRNKCAAGCGKELTEESPAVLVPDIGKVCSECMLPGAAAFVETYPRKKMGVPSYK